MSQVDQIETSKNQDQHSCHDESEKEEVRRGSRERIPSYKVLLNLEQEKTNNFWKITSDAKKDVRTISEKLQTCNIEQEELQDMTKSLRDTGRKVITVYDELRENFSVPPEIRLAHDRIQSEIETLVSEVIQLMKTKKSPGSLYSRASTTSSHKLILSARAASLQAEREARRKEAKAKLEISHLEAEEMIRRVNLEAEERTREVKVKLELEQRRQELEDKRLETEIEKNKAELRELSRLEEEEETKPLRKPYLQFPQSDNYNDKYGESHFSHPQPEIRNNFEGNYNTTHFRSQPFGPPLRTHNDDLLYHHPSSRALHYDSTYTRPQASDTILANLVESMNLSRLPVPEPSVFTGNPLYYPIWKASFDTLITTKGIAPNEKIHYLHKYLGDEAKTVVEGTFYLKSEEAYERAMHLLEKRYGDSFLVAEAFRDKLQAFPRISMRDNKALRKFADLLQQCLAAMDQIKGLEILNDCHENKKLLAKLPDWLVQRWARIIAERDLYPSYQTFTNFVTKEADIACHPITSSMISPSHPHHKHEYNSYTGKHNSGRTLASSTNEDKLHCLMCETTNHNLQNCGFFKRKTPAERKEFLMKAGICFSCLSQGHRSKECTNRAICDKCKKKHPTSMHGDYEALNPMMVRDHPTDVITKSSLQEKKHEPTVQTAVSHKTHKHSRDLKSSLIIPVYLSCTDQPYEEHLTYAMLDTQSDTTFILEETSAKLRVQGEKTKLKLSTMTSTTTVDCKRFVNLQVRGLNSLSKITLPVTYSREFIPANRNHIPTSETAKGWPHLRKVEKELPPELECEIGLLIGYNCPQALAPIRSITGMGNQPFAQETALGWSIIGRISTEEQEHDSSDVDEIGHSHKIITTAIPDSLQLNFDVTKNIQYVHNIRLKEEISPQITKLLEADFPERKYEDKVMSQEDIKFVKIMENGIHKDENGFYEMPLPFKTNDFNLENNKVMAISRLEHLKRKFKKNEGYYNDYIAFMQEIIERGDAEEVNEEEELKTNTWYIPHHGVYHPKKPNKIRVVFDCSARYKGTSLNDQLLQGPDFMNTLVGVLIRFREDKIAFICDIEKMFHQFKVNPEHRDFLRFLWWKDGKIDSKPRSYRMNVHIFGATSSPGCANYGLKKLAIDQKSEFDESTSKFILNDFYVDDGLTSCPDEEEAIQLIANARQICKKANIRLHKFICNSEKVIRTVPISERAQDMAPDITLEETGIERALGIQWCVNSDEFRFKFMLQEKPKTRRGILSTVASIYDPLGCIAPFTLIGKQILQDMCKENSKWDDPPSEDLSKRWDQWQMDLPKLANIRIQRFVQPQGFSEIKHRELHHFSDASTSGYGQCSYLRLVNDRNEVFCTLIMGKARVTPSKVVTIPRLELTAALISVKISKMLKQEMKHKITKEVFWTDSKITLAYIKNEAKRFHVFVANRVQQIKENTNLDQWHYVNTDVNPADHASRGLFAAKLETSNWFTGPKFLWNIDLPLTCEENQDITISSDDPEVKKAIVNTVKIEDTEDILLKRIKRFSKWSTAVSAINILRKACKKSTNLVDRIDDKQNTEILIIQKLQHEVFQDEISNIENLQRSSRLYNLDPFIDETGLLRVGGRLKFSAMPHDVRHPIILPRTGHITELIIRHYHEKVFHQGRGITTNEIRSNGYWIIGMSKAVSSFIHKCVTCRKLRGSRAVQKMANLPEDRTEPAPPFTHCGIDCFGPFIVKDGRKELKRYGLLITCMASRAIHIEMLEDMSTDAFINGLRCFISLRGPVRSIRCDRGTNFVGASNELKKALNEITDDTVRQYLMKNNCEFHMNAPYSSHMGGVWERQIRTIRSILSAILQQNGSRIDSCCLRTYFYEVMAIVNSRPLTTDSLNEPDGLEPLTPNHLITMKSSIILPPPGNFEKEDLYARKRWRRVQFLANEFWLRWKKEYLQKQQPRQKWNKVQRNIKVGDIVIVHEDGLIRGQCRLGKIIETMTDKDDLVRKVKVLVGDRFISNQGKRTSEPTVFERPIQKLTVLIEQL